MRAEGERKEKKENEYDTRNIRMTDKQKKRRRNAARRTIRDYPSISHLQIEQGEKPEINHTSSSSDKT